METPMRRFEDRSVLVTGAASGIGRATVERIAREGGRVFCADVQSEAVEAAAKHARELGAEAEARVCDVSDEAAVNATVAACVERFGGLHALCHVAGILRFAHTHEMPFDDWRRIQAVNADGTFLVCRAVLPHLVASGGNIVNVSSVAAKAGLAYGAAYAASKGAVLALTKALAVEYGKQGVRANSVCPGSIKTPMTAGGAGLPKDADMKLVMRQMALDRARGPETVASVIAFLASDDAAHINGEDILVDGGTLA
jgi:NAD(P)-dependent dehydrogenase (short-subunit alcohol dehydrogenase family)